MNKFYLLSLFCQAIPRRGTGWLLALLIGLPLTCAQAQTITGTAFFDGNTNGVKDAPEVGYGSVTVKAYAASATGTVTTTSSALTSNQGSLILRTKKKSFKHL